MSRFARVSAAVCAGFLAAFVLKALGAPWWRDGGFGAMGDQADGFVCAFALVLALTSRKATP